MIALAMGGDGRPGRDQPELTAKLIALDDVRTAARMIVVGDRRVLDDGARIAGVPIDIEVVRPGDPRRDSRRRRCGAPGSRRSSVASQAVPAATMRSATIVTRCSWSPMALPTPFASRLSTSRRCAWRSRRTRTRSASPPACSARQGPATEFNVLDRLWNARVTSHVPLARVCVAADCRRHRRCAGADHGRIARGGFEPPRIGVAALNPTCRRWRQLRPRGDRHHRARGGSAKAKGFTDEGPYPADTVFVRARAANSTRC